MQHERVKDTKRRHHEYDERGHSKNSRSASKGRIRENKSKRRKKTWPPHFPDDANSYVFDARSGFFYDAMSDFFYDPKTKLYYGNEKKTYYEYCNEEDVSPRFREVDQQKKESLLNTAAGMMDVAGQTGGGMGGSKLESSGQDLVVQALQGGTSNRKKIDFKNKIAICLKKKPSGGKSGLSSSMSSKPTVASVDDSSNTMASLPSSHLQKKHKADMEKWSQRGKQTREPSDNAGKDISVTGNPSDENESVRCVTAIGNVENTSEGKNSKPKIKVKTTVCGKPICVLCKRKFSDIDKLRQHEKLSSLHKKNLAKKKLQRKNIEENNTTATPIEINNSAEYRDRAKERRRMLNQTSSSTVPNLLSVAAITEGPSLTKARVVTTTETVTPGKILGESNIGNQLLQKLGWKKGSSLGRTGAMDNNPDNIITTDGVTVMGDSSAVTNKLKEDWERIESLAGGGSSRSRSRKFG